ncbi:unnamed protein product [Adineta steineri]|uniref:Uncharacterized protein n=1 Tax=Adineta steineri TaxID=433720 RepID=A0A814T3T7_9BILA|nr:unnamed protein product [Adineta steineri]
MKMYGDPEKRLLDIPEQVYPILPQSWWKSTLNVMQNNRFYVVVLVILIGTGIAIAFISRDTAHQQNDIITDNQGWIILKSLGWNMKYAADDQNPYNNGPQQYQSMNNVSILFSYA